MLTPVRFSPMLGERIDVPALCQVLGEATRKHGSDGHLIIGSYAIEQRVRHQTAMACSRASLT
jgi:hypothetical protein